MSIAIFASGSGSNFQVLVERSKSEEWSHPISLLICDKPSAKVVERAQTLGIPFATFAPKEFTSKEAYEQAVLHVLQEHSISWIVLAGYMRLIGPILLKAYRERIFNIHPSLLPAFPGKNGIADAFHHPVKVSGITVHLVDEGLDTGPILAQVPVAITPEDTLDTFAEKIHRAEHQLYPQVVRDWIAKNKF